MVDLTPSLPSDSSQLPGFKVGTVVIDSPLVLAPMAGLTDVTFRRIVRRCGGVGLVVSELLSSEGVVRDVPRALENMAVAPDEHPIALQLSGSNPERMAESARRCVDIGADIVDLNMGCPAPKVTRNGAGAALLRTPEKAAALAAAVVKAVEVPVTAKLRLGWSEAERTFIETSRLLEDSGVAALTLHARTGRQRYSGSAEWKAVGELKHSVSIPVVGNGDITRPEHALERLRASGCDGVMIGRAALKNPWIFGQILQLAESGGFSEPKNAERIELIRDHFNLLLESLPPKPALFRMKSFLGKYTAGMDGAVSLRRRLNDLKTPGQLTAAFEEWVSASRYP